MTNEYVSSMFSLEGQVALVSGASSGIGAEFAFALARAGADVVLGARRTDKTEAIATKIMAETGRKAVAVPLDVKDRATVLAAFDTAEKTVGTPTIVCNNAGIGNPAWALEETEEQWDAMMDTNLKGMWFVGTEAARRMIAAGKKGSIINTASVLGLGASPKALSYATSKAAVVQMTRVMALEWQRNGIRVNSLCPGYFITEINDYYLDSKHGAEMLRKTPGKRAGNLAELVPALLMFAAPASGFTTGTALPVDGGHSIQLI